MPRTVGGNICMSLPAGPMITMMVTLEAMYLLWAPRMDPEELSPQRISLVTIIKTRCGGESLSAGCRCYGFVVTAPSDMGGRVEFFGPVVREPNEPVFHTRGEGRVFGMALFVLTLLGRNIDAFRFAMERLPREVYLSGYYPRWLAAVEGDLVRGGYLDPGEVDGRLAGCASPAGTRRISRMRLAAASRMISFLLRPHFPRWFAAHALPRLVGGSRPTLRGPRFAAGDRVRVGDRRTTGHTRRPGYVVGKPGVVVAHLGSTTFPDAHAVGRHARPQHLYTVSFQTGDLWGNRSEPAAEVCVDLYEAYLEPA